MDSSVLENITIPDTQDIDLSDISKGIDNYHIDLKISPKFQLDLNNFADALIRQKASFNSSKVSHEDSISTLRKNYLDVMTVLIHRVKTDLTPTEVGLLQFAIPKFILSTVRKKLDDFVNEEKVRSSELRTHGSGKALGAHQHLAWLGKNYNTLLFIITKAIFDQLKHVENKELASIRTQYLDSSFTGTRDVIFNSLLMAKDITRPKFLVTHYLLWNRKPELDDFEMLNKAVESLVQDEIPDFQILPLKEDIDQSAQREIYDCLGGFQNCKNFLGICYDTKSRITEEYCWLDEPSNIDTLYNLEKLKESATNIKSSEGFSAAWKFKQNISQSKKLLKSLSRLLKKKKILEHYIASYKTKELRNKKVALQVDPDLLCQYLCDELTLKQLQNRLIGDKSLDDKDLNSLKETQAEVQQELQTNSLTYAYKFLLDLSRFRKDLKQYRLAHRLFNRISILDSQEDIRLSKEANTLYHLNMQHEAEESGDKIVHHAILKADIRGSTTVTHDLENKGLNPASYFSKRFFGPINAMLKDYGAEKVFIEGDAIILSFLEHENNPQQWFAVARACGLARTLLKIVHTNNQYSQEMGLPLLELGIGICFSDEAPRFLYDEDKPIMISSAIGLADRLSSCSWKLRSVLQPGSFNVAVLDIAEGEKEKGEKGQHHMRFNVNGILLDNDAFTKLKQEVHFVKKTLKMASQSVSFLYGTYPDWNGKKRSLVIREGKVGLWQNNNMTERPGSSEYYYEVITNEKINSLIRTQVID